MTVLETIGKFSAADLVQLGEDQGDGALFGPLGLDDPYRYALSRKIGPGTRRLLFVMLNPSKATHEKTDPTITRCIGFGRRLGFGFLDVVNAYAWRATDPKELKLTPSPIGEFNDTVIRVFASRADMVICAWGTKAGARGGIVKQLLREAHPGQLYALKTTLHGHPQHPLFVRAVTQPVAFQ